MAIRMARGQSRRSEMKYLPKTCMLAFVLLWTLARSAEPESLDGWRNAKWGMTEGQVLNVFKGEARKTAQELQRVGTHAGDTNEICLVRIPDLAMHGKPFSVDFVFEKERKTLKRIRLSCVDDDASERLFSLLEKDLTAKYGKPHWLKDHADQNLKKRYWKVGKTEIWLVYAESSKWLGLTYEEMANDAK
jgi:hypothetical protein